MSAGSALGGLEKKQLGCKDRTKNAERVRAWRTKLTKDTISVLGGQCRNCGESQWQFLVIDHVNDDGHEDRVRGLSGGTGYQRYRALQQDGYNWSKELQLLCASCNLKKKLIKQRSSSEVLSAGAERGRRYRSKLKAESVSAYHPEGKPECSCCGASDIDVLELQHIDGDSQEHYAELGLGRTQVTLFRSTLRKLGWPKDRPIVPLCANCHMAADFRGGCPHGMTA